MSKRELGQFFTKRNPFNPEPFESWLKGINLGQFILEPFAGDCDIPVHLSQFDFHCFDIEPRCINVSARDSLKNFPTGYDTCITNPPYLGKSSAKRMGVEYDSKYPDLYLESIKRILDNCKYAALIIPGAFLSNRWFKSYLTHADLISESLFDDTTIPVMVAYFNKETRSRRVKIYKDGIFIKEITNRPEDREPKRKNDIDVIFNCEDGNIGLHCIDGTSGSRIRFVPIEELSERKVVVSDRAISKLKLDIDVNQDIINRLNILIEEHRTKFLDTTLTTFRGIQKNGDHRKRISFDLARKLINSMEMN